MKWLKRLVIAMLGLLAAVALAWLVFGDQITGWVRGMLREQIESALGEPVKLRDLKIRPLPPRVEVKGLEIGADGDVLRVGEASVGLLPVLSLRQWRPVGELRVRDLFVDVGELPSGGSESETPQEGPMWLPAFRLQGIDAENTLVRIPGGGEPTEVKVGRLAGSVEAGGESHRLAVDLKIDDAVLRRAGGEVSLDVAGLQASQTERGFAVDRLSLRGDPVSLTMRAESRRPLRHSIEGEIHLAPFAALDPGLSGLAGDVEIDATLTGPLQNAEFAGSLDAAQLVVADRPIGDVSVRASRRGDTIEVQSASIRGFGGEAKLDGTLTLSGEMPFRTQLGWSDLRADEVAAVAAGLASVPPFMAAGDAKVSGTLSPPSVEGSGSGRLVPGRRAAAVEWKVSGHYGRSGGEARLDIDQGGANSVSGTVSVGAEKELGGDLEVRLGDTTALQALAGTRRLPKVSGNLVANVRLAGTVTRPELTGDVDGRDVAALGAEFERIQGRFDASRERVEIPGLTLALDGGVVSASGTIGIEKGTSNSWRVEARDLSVDALASIASSAAGQNLPLRGGTLSASATGSGPWSHVHLDAHAQIERFFLSHEPFQSLALDLSGTWPQWTAAVALQHREGEAVRLNATGTGAEYLDARVESSTWSLEHVTGASEAGASGTVQVSGELQGPPSALSGQLQVKGERVTWNERPLGDVDLEAKASQGAWRLQGALLNQAVRVEAELGKGHKRLQAQVSWTDAELGPLLSDDPTLRLTASGSLDVSAPLSDPQRMDASLLVSSLTARSGTFEMKATEPVRVLGKNGAFTIQSFQLAGNGTQISIDGTATAGGALDLTARGQGSLQLIELVGDPIQSARGHFDFAIEAKRPAGGRLDLSGQLSLQKAALDMGLPFGLTRTSGLIELRGPTIRIAELSGGIGGGTFQVGGSIDLRRGPDLTWQVKEMSTGMVPSFEHELSGHGAVTGTWTDFTASGEIQILRALYDKRIELTDFLPSFKRELAKAPGPSDIGPSQRTVHLDLRVFAPNQLYIDNNFAKIEAQMDLNVTGTDSKPRLSGKIQVITGEIYFRGNTFDVTTGVIDFRPSLGLTPYLDIVAESSIETPDATYTVTLQVTGPADDVHVTMSADDPSLTQNDIASLIAFGKTSAQLQQEGEGVSLADLLVIAPGGYPEKVEKGTAKLLGVDRVEIEPNYSRQTGAFEPEVKVGKDFTEDLTASVATTFGVEARQIVELLYRLTPSISLLGLWESETVNQQGAVGGQIKFHYDFRDTPGISLLGHKDEETGEAAKGGEKGDGE
jgi:autotransporter translocation and assembly factor TamB